MNIDDKRFIKFNQFLFLYNYKINYIDEAHKQSLPKLSVNIIYKNGGFDYQRYFAKNSIDLFEHIMQAIEADTNHKIARIFCRIGDAVLCLVRYD